jgi:hypothetical protein
VGAGLPSVAVHAQCSTPSSSHRWAGTSLSMSAIRGIIAAAPTAPQSTPLDGTKTCPDRATAHTRDYLGASPPIAAYNFGMTTVHNAAAPHIPRHHPRVGGQPGRHRTMDQRVEHHPTRHQVTLQNSWLTSPRQRGGLHACGEEHCWQRQLHPHQAGAMEHGAQLSATPKMPRLSATLSVTSPGSEYSPSFVPGQ